MEHRLKTPPRPLVFASVASLIASLSLVTPAMAQSQDVDLPRFEPAPAGDRFFGVPSPYVPGEVAFHGGVGLDYAHAPLSLVDADDETVAHVIEHQLLFDVNLALALANRFEINAEMPFALVNQGDGAIRVGDLEYVSPDGPGIGDLRLGLRVRLFGGYHDPFQIGLGGYVWVPTSTVDAFLGSGFRGEPQLLIGGRADRFIYSTKLGFMLAANATDVGTGTLQHRFQWGAGVGVLLGATRRVQLGVETSGAFELADPSLETLNAEVLAGIKVRAVAPLEIGLAAGPGLGQGVGTPDVRGVFSIAYTPEVPLPGVDRDGDGVLDPADACPQEPGKPSDDPKKNGCPPDADGDGVLDAADACPKQPGKPSEDPKKHGCPAFDRDADGIDDAEDACVEVKGVKSDDPRENGCPPDTDGDGFRDDVDACPEEKGVDDADPQKRGCPRLVRVTEKEIVILEQVRFDTGRATIQPASNALLDSVAQVLSEHPEIRRLEVQGHTDDRGAAGLNAKLSQDRADAVRKALVARGIDGARLSAKGYGPSQPIDDNRTEEGRKKNRRVQFVVLEKGAK